jgi:uncharacterized FlaG/YvyC family protein
MDVLAITSAVVPLSTGEAGFGSQNQNRRLLANAVAAICQSDLWPGRMLKIHYDTTAQKLTVQIVNSETEEVLDQIPSEEVLRLALELASQASVPSDQGNALA